MSRATKRKHVINETMQDYFTPPTEEQQIVCVVTSRGNNLLEVTSSDETFLVSMPTKFRKNIWVKRGDFVIVEPIKEGNKVKAEMVKVLSKDHIKYFKKINVWPAQFNTQTNETPSDDLEENLNNKVFSESDDSSSDDSEEESINSSKEEG